MSRKTSIDAYGTLTIPRIHSEIAHILTKELGIPCAEIARQLGISGVAVLKMLKRENNHG